MKSLSPLVLVICVGLTMIGCEEAVVPTRYFTIKKGTHYCTPRVSETLQANYLQFEARFDHTAMYDFGDPALQSSKNKLMGFSDCNSLHHENSARFAWQWYGGRLEIYAYCYVNGERVEQYIGTVAIGEKNKYTIWCKPDYYEFRLNDEEIVRIQRGNTCDKGIYYMLWPYFGGSIAAPHDITIEINRIYH